MNPIRTKTFLGMLIVYALAFTIILVSAQNAHKSLSARVPAQSTAPSPGSPDVNAGATVVVSPGATDVISGATVAATPAKANDATSGATVTATPARGTGPTPSRTITASQSPEADDDKD
jgi:hypothetical protein